MLLRGTSADAMAGLREKLDAADPAQFGQLGEDLLGVSGVLRAEPGLRRVVTDASTDPSAKSGLVRQLFDGKLSATGLDLVADAVGRRWAAPRHLADVLEYLGVVALVKSVGDDVARLADELFTVGEVVNTATDLRDALSDPARSTADKVALVTGLLEGKALPATVRLAQLALNGSYRTPTVALEEYQKIAGAVRGEGVAKVRVARELSGADQQRLQDALSRSYGRSVHVNVVVEPDLVGGMRIEIGDDVIDGSVLSRLDDARRRLAG